MFVVVGAVAMEESGKAIDTENAIDDPATNVQDFVAAWNKVMNADRFDLS